MKRIPATPGFESSRVSAALGRLGITILVGMIWATAGLSDGQVLNEFVANHTSTDDHEYVEIFGAPSTDYSHLRIVQIEGDTTDGPGMLDSATAVGTTDGNGFWYTGFLTNVYHNNHMTLLLVEGYSGTVGTDLDTDDDGVLDITPWSAIVDEVAVEDDDVVGHVYSTVILEPGADGVVYTWGGASRIPNGVDTDTAGDWVRNDFYGYGLPGFGGELDPGEAANTPGEVNQALEPVTPVVNEFVANHSGVDDYEFIEVFGNSATYYGYAWLVVLEGDVGANPGTVDATFRVGFTGGGGAWSTPFLSSNLEDGSLTIVLARDWTGAVGNDLDTNDDGVFDLTPWTTVFDTVALSDGDPGDVAYSETVLVAGFDGLPSPPGGGSRVPSGVDSDTTSDWFRNDSDGAGSFGSAATLDSGEAYNTRELANRVGLDDYYAGVDSVDSATLRATLHEAVDDHIRHEYTTNVTDTWDILEAAQEDPNNPSNILDTYKNASYPKAGGGNSNYDREHTWPKSFGFAIEAATNTPYTDCHHLYLADGDYNGARSNHPYRYCDASCAELTTEVNNGTGGGSGVYPGFSNWDTGSFSDGTWETWIGRRGDVARAQMYMDVRYEGATHGITGFNEPQLILTDDDTLIVSSSGNESVAYMGILSDIYQWHLEDPVTDEERARNEAVYLHQGNRNPFVDHPEWAECLYFDTGCAETIFADDFESGNFDGWSVVAP